MRKVAKAFALITAVGMSLSLAACGNAGNGASTGEPDDADQASAPDFPTKRIEVVVPWGAGGGSDQITRQLANAAESVCGWTISVTNAEGGGGAVGAAQIAGSAPDGYTVGSVDSSILYYTPSGTADIHPDQFRSVMRFNERPTTIGVSTKAGYSTIEELIEAAKGGERITIAVNSLGGVHHISALGFANAAGIELEYIPYPQGAASAIQGILAGEVDGLIADDAEMLPFAEAGEINPLALMTGERGTVFPDVPTLEEIGVDWANAQWRGLVVPASTPDDVTAVLEECFIGAAQSDAYLQFMEANGFTPRADSAEAFQKIIDEDYAKAEELSASLS